MPSAKLLNFTIARYVRLRLQKIRTLNADLMSLPSSSNQRNISALALTGNAPESDRSLFRRLFYSIKDISIGGQCVCYGHAAACPFDTKIKVTFFFYCFLLCLLLLKTKAACLCRFSSSLPLLSLRRIEIFPSQLHSSGQLI